MKLLLAILLCFPLLTSYAQEVSQQDGEALIKSVIDDFQQEAFENVRERFDERMKENFSLEQMQEVWKNLNSQFGAYQDHEKIRMKQQQGYDVVLSQLNFKNESLDLQLALNEEKQISGMFFQPLEPAADQE